MYVFLNLSGGGNREEGGSSNANANRRLSAAEAAAAIVAVDRARQQDPFIDDGKPIDISDDDLPF